MQKSVLAVSLLLAMVDLGRAGKQLHLKTAENDIAIDGIIDAEWAKADSISDFFQLLPYYGKPPAQPTIAKVLTTNEVLYCLMVCYDARENIQYSSGVLDQTSGDVVSIMLDTFGDKQTAYKCAVTASGVRADCRLLDDARNRDYSWDGVWFSDAKIYDWGFVVEIKIPYKSLRYDRELREWGLDFDRWVPSRSEDLYWCTYEQNEGQRISKFGKLIFDNFQPASTGMNVEVYPVAISKTTSTGDGKYKTDPDAGIDLFYNPSEKLTYQLTANPDFAQIEADPYEFNISRYETYFDERRPFFTEGNEVFMAAGRQNNSGFYRPLELFYPRRIGRVLPDGSQIPLILGTKAFGRLDSWEYGGFLAMTGSEDYAVDGENKNEPRSYFGSVRLKKQIIDNSSVGFLFVGKKSSLSTNGVFDIDGAFRTAGWQLAYQVARSVKGSRGDFAGSVGFTMMGKTWMNYVRVRAIGNEFDVQQIGFVPWMGTVELGILSGPVWFFDEGYIRKMLLYGGPYIYYEHADLYTDYAAFLGFEMQFRDNWGYEIGISTGRSKDQDKKYANYEVDLSSWYNISPKWNGNLWGGYSRTYNFSRNYLAFYSWLGLSFAWKALSILELGTSYNMWIEGNPQGKVEDITYNARPFVSLSPFNDLKLRVYLDNVYQQSANRLQRVLVGFLFSYNFLPKSWIYLSINEVRDRSEERDGAGNVLPQRLHVTDQVGVAKVKYLYYF
jgi:hypothetical protein